jgi:hypothetical protein
MGDGSGDSFGVTAKGRKGDAAEGRHGKCYAFARVACLALEEEDDYERGVTPLISFAE